MAPEYYIFTGQRVPRHVTHVLIDKSLKFVPARAFEWHPNIEELICHDGVEKIEECAFCGCPRLRRVIMPGVKEIERSVFYDCEALTHIECGKLEIIGAWAFRGCKSLSSIDLPSIKIVEQWAFGSCINLINVMFGKDLESIRLGAFYECTSLERITLPLKNNMIANHNTFQGCENLNHIDLVEGAVLHETVSALLNEEWKNNMNEEIDSISQILTNTNPGTKASDVGRKARAWEIRVWIASVLRKIIRYKAEHRRRLNEATTTLENALPNDILLKNVLPFVELPSYTFDGED